MLSHITPTVVCDTSITIVRTEVALSRYKLATGSYPNNLFELVANYLAAQPEDTFGAGRNSTDMLRHERKVTKDYLLYGGSINPMDDRGNHSSNPARWQEIFAGKLLMQAK